MEYWDEDYAKQTAGHNKELLEKMQAVYTDRVLSGEIVYLREVFEKIGLPYDNTSFGRSEKLENGRWQYGGSEIELHFVKNKEEIKMLYTFRDVTDVMKKIRDYLDKHPNGKTAEKANKIIQVYMDYPKEFIDMKVYVKGRPPMNEWSIGSDALFFVVTKYAFNDVIDLTEKDWESHFVVAKYAFNDVIDLTEKDWENLNAIREKNLLAPLKFPIRTKTQKQFIDYIYEVYCT